MESRLCRFCGALVETGDKKCLRCGADIELQSVQDDSLNKRESSVIIPPWSLPGAFPFAEPSDENEYERQSVPESNAAQASPPAVSGSSESGDRLPGSDIAGNLGNAIPSVTAYADYSPDYEKASYKFFQETETGQPAFRKQPDPQQQSYGLFTDDERTYSQGSDSAYESETVDQDDSRSPGLERNTKESSGVSVSAGDSSDFGSSGQFLSNIDQDKWNQWMRGNIEMMRNLHGYQRGKKVGNSRILFKHK